MLYTASATMDGFSALSARKSDGVEVEKKMSEFRGRGELRRSSNAVSGRRVRSAFARVPPALAAGEQSDATSQYAIHKTARRRAGGAARRTHDVSSRSKRLSLTARGQACSNRSGAGYEVPLLGGDERTSSSPRRSSCPLKESARRFRNRAA